MAMDNLEANVRNVVCRVMFLIQWRSTRYSCILLTHTQLQA